MWIDDLNAAQLKNSYEEWKEGKRDMDEPSDLTFAEWLQMEREICR